MLDISFRFNDILIHSTNGLIAFTMKPDYDPAKESIDQYRERKKDIHRKQKELFTVLAEEVMRAIPVAKTCVIWDSYDYSLAIKLPIHVNNPNVRKLLRIILPFCSDDCQAHFEKNYPELMKLTKNASVTKIGNRDNAAITTRSVKSDTQIVCTLGLHSPRVVEETRNAAEESERPRV